MTDWSAILAHAFEMARKCGDTGDSGDSPANALLPLANSPRILVTARNTPAVTVVTFLDDHAVTAVTTASAGGGDKVKREIPSTTQEDRRSVTTVTAVTVGIYPRGRCVMDRLRSMVPPESFSPEAWHQLLLDTDSFFQRWAEQAELLAWSDKDLIGVHPRAPAARYDAMGLLFLIRGGEVIELHDQCATIRSQRGSLLVYRKYGHPGAVLLWEIGLA
jgi:hypothetical protein